MIYHKNDFIFTLSLFEEFFSQKKIQNSLQTINKTNITGWEIWFQVEFATFLENKHNAISEWYREWEYPLDKRKSLKNKMFIDFLVRQKYAKKDSYIALELKQNISAKTCITNMIKDVNKVTAIRKSSSDIRSFWNIGIYKRISDNHYQDKEKIEKIILSKFNTEESFIESKYIKNTNFAYTIF